MKIVFLDVSTLGNVPNLGRLKQFGDLSTYETTAPEQLEERIRNAEIIITNKVVINRQAIETASRLKLICVAATGTNNIDQEAAAQRGIVVKNVAGYSTHSVAQLTFTLILTLLGQPGYYDTYVKSGGYARSHIFTHLERPFWQLKGKQLGIIGLGNIGRQVASIAEAFGMEVVYYSSSGQHNEAAYRRLDLHELLASSDIVSIHAPLSERTAGLFGTEQFRQMKPTALLINTSRGGIIREGDLALALDEGLIAGAGLDVFEREPIQINNPLLSIKNADKLVLTPHIAWASLEARTLLIDKVCQNIESFMREGKAGSPPA
jgi:lactate dehydrogenase-like 2-hydroxyacid dehydrogenase